MEAEPPWEAPPNSALTRVVHPLRVGQAPLKGLGLQPTPPGATPPPWDKLIHHTTCEQEERAQPSTSLCPHHGT